MPSHDSGFEHQLEQNLRRLLAPGQPVLLAVSGGRDSMGLLHATTRLRSVLELPFILVAHLDHGLRGEAGRDDAELVRSTCRTLNVPVVVSECDAGQLERAARGSLEEAARTARYDFLHRTAKQHSIPLIVTAHHAADQAETVLHNIIRGTGIRGLRGVPERRRLSDTVELIRPMLTIQECALTEYVQHYQIAFAIDATNDSHAFTRNRIRHQLLPLLAKDFNVSIQDSIVRLAGQAEELLQILDGVAEELLKDAVLEQTPGLCRLDVLRLTQQPPAIVRHAMTVLWQQQNWPRRDMSGPQWHRLTALLFNAPPAALDLPGLIRAELRGNLLALTRNADTP
ncbi:MAG: tRNA lysidine(34) synthetase TilS [Planctomycetaceae bacterium]|nr:tRNA lysidine(34) synthetase TilS [Planctomycetaceae bacterium]